MKRWMYMYVTDDVLQLPIYVADTSEEMARLSGYSRDMVERMARSTGKKHKRIFLIKYNDDEDE